MFFVIVGVLIIAANLVGLGPFASWTWEISGDLWKFCVPFLLALLWWIWSDKSGLNKRREMKKMEDRKNDRRRENMAKMGLKARPSVEDRRHGDHALRGASERPKD